MAEAYFLGSTLDDVMRDAIAAIYADGDAISPSKGLALEIRGVLIEITNPRARLSRTESRGKLFSALGELCWYLAKTNDLDFIEYYIHKYEDSADGSKIFGGYGPRLFSWKETDQVANMIDILTNKIDSRQAVVQLFDASDILTEHKDIPCTCTLQFMNRDGKLDMFVNMRSNDVHWGLPHDVFCFTMLQEIIARAASIDLGTYKHTVGSLHLYTKHFGATKKFIREGLQPTAAVMPAMPTGDPWPALALLLHAEDSIRKSGLCDEATLADMDPYWRDLIRLLQIYRAEKFDKDVERILMLRGKMSSSVYFPYIERTVRRLVAIRKDNI